MMGIYIVVVPFILLVVMLLINTYYLKVVHANSQENHIIKGLNGKYDAIALGSAYCRYGIDFSETNVNGYNFGYASQFFYYTDKMLRYIAPKCLNKGGTVYLIIADLVFASIGKKELNYKGMMRFLPYSEFKEDNTIWEYLQTNYPVFFRLSVYKESIKFFAKSILGRNKLDNSFDTLTINPLSEEEIENSASKRCEAWCKQFGLKDTMSNEIPESLNKTFDHTVSMLAGMIDYCKRNGYKPILVVTPVSKNMQKMLSSSFLDIVLYDNISRCVKNGVCFYDCLNVSGFKEGNLYFKTADFLNKRGRTLFTKYMVRL